MKKCTNCGAEYDSELLKCPYCEFENAQVAQENYRDKIEDLIEEREEIRKLPKKVTAKRTKIVFSVVAFMLVAVVFIMVVMEATQKMRKEQQVEQEQHNKDIMERYLNDKDYAQFYSYYQSLDYAYLVYNKYDEISTVYYWYECMESDFEYQFTGYNAGNKDVHVTWVALALNEYCTMLKWADEYLNDNYRYGNEEHIQAICDIATERLKEMYQMDDAMLEAVLAVEKQRGEDSTVYNEIAEDVVENFLN